MSLKVIVDKKIKIESIFILVFKVNIKKLNKTRIINLK